MSPIVDIPGMPGERIDQRILADVLAIIRQFKVKVTDGYAASGHAASGEHPLGLAIDIVPDTERGGTWDDVDRLVKWAEPTQNKPRAPFRWVGYDGDAGHGRGHHAHLSWAHPGGRVQTLGGDLPSGTSGSANEDGAGGVAGALATGAGGVVAGATGATGAAGAVAGAAAGAARALIEALWDALGLDGARILLYIALAAGGATLAVVGLSRALGVGAPNPAKLAALTPIGRAGKIAAS